MGSRTIECYIFTFSAGG